MKLKLDANGNAVLIDGKPVYTHDDGSEHPFDAAAARTTIATRNNEAKGLRERAEAAEAQVAKFAGIEDPAKALEALKVVGNLDAKKLIDAGEVDKLRETMNKDWQAKFDAESAKVTKLSQQLDGEVIGGAFSRSKYIAEKLAIPVDMAQAVFGKNVKLVDGKMVAVDAQGNTIMSKERIGENATFDEAMEQIVSAYPNRDKILKATQGAGTGAQPAAGQQGAKTMTRSAFEAIDPPLRGAKIKEGFTIVDG